MRAGLYERGARAHHTEPGRHRADTQLYAVVTAQQIATAYSCRMHALIAVLLLTAGEPEPPAVVTEEIVLACKGVTCTDDGPKDEWDLPSCVDESLHDALIENARHGDRSAVELLRGRYDLATTHRERHRIAVELLGRVTNDRIYWHDLESYARIAVRFPKGEEGDLPNS